MNIIIIAACIPTLRPIFLVLFKRPGAENFRASVRERGHSSYHYRTADIEGSKKTTTNGRASRVTTESTEAINDKDAFDDGCVIQVKSIEVVAVAGDIEAEWGHVSGSSMPMTNIGSAEDVEGTESGRSGGHTAV